MLPWGNRGAQPGRWEKGRKGAGEDSGQSPRERERGKRGAGEEEREEMVKNA